MQVTATAPRTTVDPNILDAVLTRLACSPGDFAEVFVESTLGQDLRIEETGVIDCRSGMEAGAGLRLVRRARTYLAHTTDLSPHGLLAATCALVTSVGGAPVPAIAVPPESAGPIREAGNGVSGVPLAEVIDRLQAAVGEMRATSPAITGTTVWSGTTRQILVVNSEGLRVGEQQHRYRVVCQAIARAGGSIANAVEDWASTAEAPLPPDFDPVALGRSCAEEALAGLSAVPAPEGEVDVVLAPGSGGVIVHEACGHGLEADYVAEDRATSRAARERRLSSAVTIIDDPTVPGAWGSYGRDDEGELARQVRLVDGGEFAAFLTDRVSARALGIERTAHARRTAYSYPPIPRMSNTYLAAGPEEPAEILLRVGSGLYCTMLGGGQANPATGDFVFRVVSARLVERGQLTRRVRPFSIMGNGFEMLERIEAIGHDLVLRPAICGKANQRIAVSTGSPTVLVRGMTLGRCA